MIHRIFLSLLIICSFSVAAYAATIQLPRTGQTVCYDAAGAVIACINTGQDGDKLAGVPSPNPRFTDNANGTITDNLTGLIWLKNANCTETIGGIAKVNGDLTWPNALTWSNNLAGGVCGLADGSAVGDWRLPNITELESLVDLSQVSPALPGGHPFTNVQAYYWSSSSYANFTYGAWGVYMDDGVVDYDFKTNGNYVWPVRAGQ